MQLKATTIGIQEAMEGCMASVDDTHANYTTSTSNVSSSTSSKSGGRRLLGGAAMGGMFNQTLNSAVGSAANGMAHRGAKQVAQTACVTTTAARALTQTMGLKPSKKSDIDAMDAVGSAAAVGSVEKREVLLTHA